MNATKTFESGEEVRHQGVIWRVTNTNSDGTLNMRLAVGSGMKKNVPATEVERKGANGFAPLADPPVNGDSPAAAPKKGKKAVSGIVLDVKASDVMPEGAFDYKALKESDERAIRSAETTIRTHIRKSVEDLLLIGKELASVQSRLASYTDGVFGDWLKATFEWSTSTAYNYIGVYNTFGKYLTDRTLDIAAQALYALASPSTPKEAVKEVVKRAQAGERITSKKAAEVIGKAKEKRQPKAAAPVAAPDQTPPVTDGLAGVAGVSENGVIQHAKPNSQAFEAAVWQMEDVKAFLRTHGWQTEQTADGFVATSDYATVVYRIVPTET